MQFRAWMQVLTDQCCTQLSCVHRRVKQGELELGVTNNEKLVLLMVPPRKERKSAGSSPSIKQVCPSMMPACLVPSCSQVPTMEHLPCSRLRMDHAYLISGRCTVCACGKAFWRLGFTNKAVVFLKNSGYSSVIWNKIARYTIKAPNLSFLSFHKNIVTKK